MHVRRKRRWTKKLFFYTPRVWKEINLSKLFNHGWLAFLSHSHENSGAKQSRQRCHSKNKLFLSFSLALSPFDRIFILVNVTRDEDRHERQKLLPIPFRSFVSLPLRVKASSRISPPTQRIKFERELRQNTLSLDDDDDDRICHFLSFSVTSSCGFF